MKNPKQTRMTKDERKNQILKSALDVFIENGYTKSTTQKIADAAGISEVTLFRHFSSKKEIFTGSIEPILLSTLEKSIVETKGLNPEEKLKYILTERIETIIKYRDVIKLILMESEINREIADIDYIGKISFLLKQSIKESGFENGNDEFIFRMLMGSILSFLYLPEINQDKIESFIDRILKTLLSS